MKQIFRKTLLVLIGGVMCSAAWGNTTIGATDKGWDNETSCTSAYTLEAGKTLTFEFTVNATRKEYVADGWVTILCSTSTRNDGAHHYVFMRDDCYGVNQWDWTNKTTAQSGWFITNENNYNWTDFQNNIIDGASVVQTIRRYGTEAFIITDVTTKTSAKYRHYFVMDLGTTDDIYAFIGADFAQLTITSDAKTDSPAPTLTGTLVGKLDKTGRLANHGTIKDFTIAPNGTLNLNFVLHSTKLFDWAQWLYEIQQDDKLYTLCVGNSDSWNDLKEAEEINKTAWPSTNQELVEKMDGATINLTVTRENAKVTMTAVHTPVSGNAFTITASVTPTKVGFATSNITVRPLVELGYLDILSSSTEVYETINVLGWSTYASDYALDFTSEIDGLTPYIVTNHTGSAITLSKVTTTVPAGTPLLLKGTAGTSYTIPVAASSDTDVSSNKLVRGTGSAVSYEAEKTKYVLSADGSDPVFKKIVDGTPATVPTNKAYLQFNEVIAARELTFDFNDDITGVNEVSSQKEQVKGEYFNIAGQRVAQPTKGLYIVNGKKVVIR